MQGKAERDGTLGVGGVTKCLEQVLMLVCGFRMKIGLDLVVTKVNLYVQEGQCLVRRVGIFVGELDCWMDRIYIANKGFQIVFSFCPNHKYVISLAKPDMWFERGVVYGMYFEFLGKNICLRRRLTGPHGSAMYL